MGKIIGKLVYILSIPLVIAFFIRFAWIKENQGFMFPTYITWLVIMILVFIAVAYYIAGDLLFGE